MRVWAVLTAAGSGSRLGADVPKALVSCSGRTLLGLALERLLAVRDLTGVVVTCPEGLEGLFQDTAAAEVGARELQSVAFVAGGASRQASVNAGLEQIRDQRNLLREETGESFVEDEDGEVLDIVLVHDAARCLAPTSLMEDLVLAVEAGAEGVIPGLPVVDTIKQIYVDDSGRQIVAHTPDRGMLRLAQTPQAFGFDRLLDLHVFAEGRAASEATAATDDAALLEEAGGTVEVIEGSPEAFKVTTPLDLERLAVALGEV